MIPVSSNPDEALTILAHDGVLAYPTESVFGLGCRADREAPTRRIRELKTRSPDQGLIVLINDLRDIHLWVNIPDDRRPLLDNSWPGPVTWLLPATPACPDWLRGGEGTLAVRMPDHPLCRHLCAGMGMALVSTSANPAGQPPARSSGTVREYFDETQVDLILDGPLGQREQPSDILNLLTEHRLR